MLQDADSRMRGRDEGDATCKVDQVAPKSTVGMPPKPTPHASHMPCLTYRFFHEVPSSQSRSFHRHPLPHLKHESEGTLLPTPTPGHSRYVIIIIYLAFIDGFRLPHVSSRLSTCLCTLSNLRYPCVHSQHLCVHL